MEWFTDYLIDFPALQGLLVDRARRTKPLPNNEPMDSPAKVWSCRRHCACSEAVTVRFETAAGWRACRQCSGCGRVSGQIKLSSVGRIDRLPLRIGDESIWKSRGRCGQCDQERALREERDALWRSNYTKYLQSDEWKRKRAYVMKRDRWRCQCCGGTATQVHHTTYERVKADVNQYNEEMRDLIAVCKPCHEEIHGRSLNGDG